MKVRLGTRASNLAMWQATAVYNHLKQQGITSEIVPLTSKGDRSLGGQLSTSVGQFIHAIDDQLLAGKIDLAIHSAKDVPVATDKRIINLAYLKRGCTDDLVIMRKTSGTPSLKTILQNREPTSLFDIMKWFPKGSTFGTVAGRRQSFLLSQRPDIIPLAVRGHVETRINRLLEGRVDAIILAETGISRLNSVGALDNVMDKLSAFRIDSLEWPTAPGQGAVAIHCLKTRSEEFENLRAILNHEPTEQDVQTERHLLSQVGGGCLFPAGISVSGNGVHIQVAPKNWRAIFCQGATYSMFQYTGTIDNLQINLPNQPLEDVKLVETGPKMVSTLNSDRISRVLASHGIDMENIPVVDLVPLIDQWPTDFLHTYESKRSWPYLILTSPFAAKCAVKAAEANSDIGRIPWLAIGEGTARACFRLGVTVAVCAKARNANELAEYIIGQFSSDTEFYIPKSELAAPNLEQKLRNASFKVTSWTAYKNKPKSVESVNVNEHDVLILSSSSSALSWAKNNLMAPHEILCMGENAHKTITSLDHFADSRVTVLSGPTSESLINWWNKHRKY